MKRWLRTLASVVMAGSMLAAMLPMGALAEGDTTVPMDEAQVLTHGRTYERDGTLYLDWTYSGISFNFEGTGAKAVLTSSSLSPNPGYVNVYVDGALVPSSSIELTQTSGEYTLAEGLADGSHTITLRKRNEAVYGGSATVGIQSLTITGGSLTTPPADTERHIEIIGDSITAGFGNLAANSDVGYNSHVSDGTSTYATMTAQAFGADIDVIARSGIRFVRADEANSMFPVYEMVSGLGNKCTDDYDFESNPKDVVIINLGTNDNGATIDGVSVTDEYIQSEAKAFLQMIRKDNPNAEIIWAYGIMGSSRASAIQAAIDELVEEGDEHISFFALDQINSATEGYGTGRHPTVATSINRSFDLTKYIAQKTGWDYRFDVQAEQQAILDVAFDTADLKMYTDESAQALTDAFAAVAALDEEDSNEDIEAAVRAVYTARGGLTIKMDEVAVIGAEEQTGTGHYMSVTYSPNPAISVAGYEGRPLYVQYEIKVETTNEPTTKDWLSYVRNGQAGVWTDSTTNDATRINAGSAISFGGEPMNAAADDYITVTAEISDVDALTSAGYLTAFKLFVYNDTEGMNGSNNSPDSDGIVWNNNDGVSIKVRNVRLMTVTSDYVNKAPLEAALETQMSEGELSAYTEESIAAYNKLFEDALAVYNNPDATQQQVNEAVASLRNAEDVLVLSDERTIAIFWSEERTTNEDHYLSLDGALTEPLDLASYADDTLMLSYDIRINTTANHPDAEAAGWLSGVCDGEARLFSVDAASASNDNAVKVGGDTNGKIHCGQNELANIKANEWLTVTVPVPQEILDAGRITKFHLFLYNNLDRVNASWANNVGVTVSLRNVKIVNTSSEPDPAPVDKTELNNLIAQAEDIDTSLYTEDTVTALNTALTAAKAVSENEDATSDQVADAVADLQAAINGLEEKPDPTPAVIYGDVDGDKEVSAADALMALQAATDKIDLTNEQALAANVDGEGDVTSSDALMILQVATQKIASFPVEEGNQDAE